MSWSTKGAERFRDSKICGASYGTFFWQFHFVTVIEKNGKTEINSFDHEGSTIDSPKSKVENDKTERSVFDRKGSIANRTKTSYQTINIVVFT